MRENECLQNDLKQKKTHLAFCLSAIFAVNEKFLMKSPLIETFLRQQLILYSLLILWKWGNA